MSLCRCQEKKETRGEMTFHAGALVGFQQFYEILHEFDHMMTASTGALVFTLIKQFDSLDQSVTSRSPEFPFPGIVLFF